MPVELLRASGVEFDEYVYTWIEALQTFWFGHQESRNTLVARLRAPYPSRL
ncbi:Imm49 family immunity protein [Streptomyces sp. NPDC026294]|uniref:Imm49 family immunity protein n=1 Tax=Streptomyces sp. NPDC026294 TaxID=3155362 RepID=UPI0033FDD618